MAKFSKARRVLLSELQPTVQAVRMIREDRRLLARLNRKLKRDEARHVQTVQQIKLSLAALQQPSQSKVANPAKQLDMWSALASEARESETDKTNTAARRLAKKIARRHEPKERATLLRLAGLLRGGLSRLRSGRDYRPVGKVTTSFDPTCRRDVLRMLELAGIEVERGQLRHQEMNVAPKNEARRGM
jgi:hypothetical protein